MSQDFSKSEEQKLTDYLKNMTNLHYELSPKQVRSFAIELTMTFNKKVPSSWTKNKCAAKNRFYKFMKRNKLSPFELLKHITG